MKNLSSTFSALMFGLVVGAFLSFASCGGGGGGGGSCSKTTCAGCCDSSGACVAGTQNTACGAAGNACQTCTGTQTCRAGGTCMVGGGTGGGSSGTGGGSSGTGGGSSGTGGGSSGTGGGSSGTGGGSGGAGGCLQITGLVAEPVGVRFPNDGGPVGDLLVFASGPGTTAGRFNVVGLELFYPPGAYPAAPRTATLGATDYQTCSDCLLLDLNCDNMGGNCTKSFLGQSGTLNVTSQSITPSDGGVVATASNIRFVEWDFQQDQAVAGGMCAQAASVSFDGKW